MQTSGARKAEPDGGISSSSNSRYARQVSLDSVELEVLEKGEGSALLVFHGFLEQPAWNPYHELLAQKYHVIAPTLPGFGNSTRPESIDSVEDLAYLFLDLIQQLQLKEIAVLGHSLGGWIAAEMAIRDCRAFSKLILVDAVGLRTLPTPVGPAGGSIADWLVLEAEETRKRALHNSQSSLPSIQLPGDPDLSTEALEAVYRNREAATQYGWRPFFFNPRLGRWLARIRVPTLIVWGEHDGIVSRDVGQAYAAGIPGASLQIVRDAAHLPHLEQPEAFVQLVTRFLETGR